MGERWLNIGGALLHELRALLMCMVVRQLSLVNAWECAVAANQNKVWAVYTQLPQAAHMAFLQDGQVEHVTMLVATFLLCAGYMAHYSLHYVVYTRCGADYP